MTGGIIAMFLLGFVLSYLNKYSIPIIIFSLLIQIIALHYMNCFKKVSLNCE